MLLNKKLFLIYLGELHSGIWFEDYTQKSAIEFVFDVELCTVHDYYSIGYKCMYVLRQIKILLRYVMNKEAQRRTLSHLSLEVIRWSFFLKHHLT